MGEDISSIVTVTNLTDAAAAELLQLAGGSLAEALELYYTDGALQDRLPKNPLEDERPGAKRVKKSSPFDGKKKSRAGRDL